MICIYGGINSKKYPEKFLGYNITDLHLINSDMFQKNRSKNLIKRFLSEISLAFTLSFKIIVNIKIIRNIDVTIWYGPSSFLWLPVFILKKFQKVK